VRDEKSNSTRDRATSGSPAEAEVIDVPEASRYELRLGGGLIGFAAYRRRDDGITFTHTTVDKSQEGHGLGSRLASAVLDDARRQGLEVVPLCPFISAYIERHAEYQDLVPASYRSRR
jgi:predicted GNAT family acetyltransferase